MLSQVAYGNRSSREGRASTSPLSATNLCLSNVDCTGTGCAWKRSSRECRAGTSPPSATNLCLSNAVHNANVRPSADYVGNASPSTYCQSRTTDKTHHLTTLVAAVVPKAGKARKQIGTTVGTTVDGNLRYEVKQMVLDPLLLSRPLLQRAKHYQECHL